MQLGVPNWIVDNSNSDDNYDKNPIPTMILSWQLQNWIKIDEFSIKFNQFCLNSTNSQLKDRKSQNSNIFN